MPEVFTHKFDSPLFSGTVSVNTGLYIGGKYVDAIDGNTIETINPVNGKVITKIAGGNAKDIDLAVKAAREAFKKSWGLKVPGYERGRLLNKLADLLEERSDEFAALESLDAGKPFQSAKAREIGTAIQAFRYYAGWADKHHGKTIETSEAKFAYTRHGPVGVCGLIVPWNLPLMLACTKMATALATGNSVILKPSEVTPLTALKFMELVGEVGFPPGTVNVVVGYGPEAGQALAEHMDVDAISFTGSTLVGRKIMQAASNSNLKRVGLELGGKSPTIIFDDCDLEQAVKWTIAGIFHNSGQMCIAGSRIFVQEGIYDKFIQAFAAAAKSLKYGSGLDPNTQEGPIVSEIQLNRVLSYIESGKADGATVVTGGARNGDSGFFVHPTIFTDATTDMKIIREEIFGPVCAVARFKDEADAIEMANNTIYGLSSVVWSENITRALRVGHAIEATQTYINCAVVPSIQVPFGGQKQSGFGKEMGEDGLELFTNIKAVHVNLGMKL